jgi:hypothetical protein
MKRLILAAMLMIPVAANATQSSMICKTDSNEYVDVVTKGERTNDVLVQINGGKFFDGHSLMLGSILVVTVELEDGGILINLGTAGNGNIIIAVGDKVQTHKMNCKFR